MGSVGFRHGEEEEDFLIESVESVNERKQRRTYLVGLQRLHSKKLVKMGDILSIYPQNDEATIQKAYDLLSLTEEQRQSSVSFQGNQVSLHRLFKEQLNLSSTCSFSFFLPCGREEENVWNFTEEPLLKEKLREIS